MADGKLSAVAELTAVIATVNLYQWVFVMFVVGLVGIALMLIDAPTLNRFRGVVSSVTGQRLATGQGSESHGMGCAVSGSLALLEPRGGHYRCPKCGRRMEAFVTVLEATCCRCGLHMVKDTADSKVKPLRSKGS